MPYRDLGRAAKGKVREDGQDRSLRFLLPCLGLMATAEAKGDRSHLTSSSWERTGSAVIAAKLCSLFGGAWD